MTTPAVPAASWSVVPTPNPSGDWGPGTLDRLNGVSCVSSSFCMASGYFVAKPAKPGVYIGAALFERWDGSDWSVVPNPGGTANAEMNSISCTEEDFCMSVGLDFQKEPPIESWNGSEWSSLPSPVPAGDIGVELQGVSCTSPSACVAVGSAGVTPGHQAVAGEGLAGVTLIESWNGSAWSIVPSPSPDARTNGLTGVSCTTEGGSFCVAVGSVQNSVSSPSHAIIEVDQGGNWSLAAEVDKVPTNASGFNGVSCSSATQCVVVGYYVSNHFDFLLDDNWDGQSWTIVPSATSVAYGMGVSCLAATNCTEVSPTGKAFVWDATSWTSIPTPSKTSSSGQVEQNLNAISCAPGLCVAVGDYVEQGSTWTYVEQGCGAAATTGTSASVSAASRMAALQQPGGASAAGGCPLDVSVKPLEPLPVRVGLAVHHQPYRPSQYPVDFVVGNLSSAERCESGCVDLMVTVTDPRTHKPVEGATINAHVSNDFSYVSGDQTLCAMNQDGTKRLGCGTSLVGSNFGFQTDDDGHVYLRYWAPGVIEPASTTLSVLARTSCSAKACPAREMVGTAQTTLRVSPYLIYAHTGGLSKDEADDLVEWAGGGNKFTRYLEKANQGLTVLNLAIKWLEHQQVLEEATLKKLLLLEEAEPVAWVVDVINLLTALGERHAMVVEFLYATDLSDVGLGDNPSESSVESLIGAQFSDFLVNQGVALPFHYGVAGAWWDLANTLRQVAAPNHGPISVNHKSVPHDDIDFSDWGVKLKVYEVSTCDPAKGYCEPGYANDPGTSVVLRVGIQPDLCFQVVLTYNGYYYDSYGFVTPYDAIAWTENQWDLRGLLKA